MNTNEDFHFCHFIVVNDVFLLLHSVKVYGNILVQCRREGDRESAFASS